MTLDTSPLPSSTLLRLRVPLSKCRCTFQFSHHDIRPQKVYLPLTLTFTWQSIRLLDENWHFHKSVQFHSPRFWNNSHWFVIIYLLNRGNANSLWQFIFWFCKFDGEFRTIPLDNSNCLPIEHGLNTLKMYTIDFQGVVMEMGPERENDRPDKMDAHNSFICQSMLTNLSSFVMRIREVYFEAFYQLSKMNQV